MCKNTIWTSNASPKNGALSFNTLCVLCLASNRYICGMKPTQKEIYDCAVKRGKITKHTTRKQFLEAIASELLELADSPEQLNTWELADIVMVCYSMAEHNGIELELSIQEKHEYNLTRKD